MDTQANPNTPSSPLSSSVEGAVGVTHGPLNARGKPTYRAQIVRNGKVRYIGTFEDFYDACWGHDLVARATKAWTKWPSKVKLNFGDGIIPTAGQVDRDVLEYIEERKSKILAELEEEDPTKSANWVPPESSDGQFEEVRLAFRAIETSFLRLQRLLLDLEVGYRRDVNGAKEELKKLQFYRDLSNRQSIEINELKARQKLIDAAPPFTPVRFNRAPAMPAEAVPPCPPELTVAPGTPGDEIHFTPPAVAPGEIFRVGAESAESREGFTAQDLIGGGS